eukprot:803052-Karenia_brevis.AAC.1
MMTTHSEQKLSGLAQASPLPRPPQGSDTARVPQRKQVYVRDFEDEHPLKFASPTCILPCRRLATSTVEEGRGVVRQCP